MRKILAHDSLADAQLDLSRQFVALFGNHPEVLDDLFVKAKPCGRGTVLVAWPRTGIDKECSNLAVAYFGPAPVLESAMKENRT